MNEYPTYNVSKVDAASRQLDTAIRLWFEGGDQVSIHTLACSAHQILSDLHRRRGGKDPIADTDLIRDEYRSQYLKLMKKEFNFFKHADNDPHEVLSFKPDVTLFFLVIGCHLMRQVGQRLSDTQQTLGHYMAVTKPELMKEEFMEEFRAKFSPEVLRSIARLERREFFRKMLEAIAMARAKGILE
jgi:hypothetical protein